MYSLIFLAVVSFVIGIVLTPLVRNSSRSLGLTDKPGDSRKIHTRPIPRTGGIAIALSYLVAICSLFLLGSHAWIGALRHQELAMKLLPGAFLALAIGLWDDIRGANPYTKLLGQLAAASVAWWLGVRITGVASFHTVGIGSYLVTILWLMACMNAFNLIDGMDGLASGIGFFATITVLVGGLLQGNVALALATVPLAGALLGFLRYNFNPATIFLGDSGSLLIGFLLGSFGVIWSQKSATLLGLTAPVMALAVPLMDTGLAIIRRLIRGQHIFGADRGHIHHRLLDRGLSPRRAAIVLYGVCGLGAAFSLVVSVANNQFRGLIIVLFCAGAWIGVQNLGYTEFTVAKRMFLHGGFSGLINAHVRLRQLEERLVAADDQLAVWEVLWAGAREFGFCRVRLSLCGAVYSGGSESRSASSSDGHYREEEVSSASWSLRIPITDQDYVNLVREFQTEELPHGVAPLIEMLRRVLGQKAISLREEQAPNLMDELSALGN